MMSIAARSGALSPYLQATKHTKSLLFPGAKELVPAAGKTEEGRLRGGVGGDVTIQLTYSKHSVLTSYWLINIPMLDNV